MAHVARRCGRGRGAWHSPAPAGVPLRLGHPTTSLRHRGSHSTDHVFWHCHPARAVRAWIATNLPQGVLIHPKHLWLLQAPPRVHHGVWWVVALAALSAIDRARKSMWSCHHAQQQRAATNSHTQLTLQEAYGRAGLMPMPETVPRITAPEAAARRAVADTAAAILDFVNTGFVPPSWTSKLQPHHPFIGCVRSQNNVSLVSNCRIHD